MKAKTRSPLRYPGGKTRAVSHILPLIPESERLICSPFTGGGSIELACVDQGRTVRGYDVFKPLTRFWYYQIYSPQSLANLVKSYYPLDKSRFSDLQKRLLTINDFDMAAAYYVLNRSSFNGTALSGGMSKGHPRFTKTAIQRIRSFNVKGFTVERIDFKESIPRNKDAFLYLDPPYLNGEKLYGVKGDVHENFDHGHLRKLLGERGRWLLSYNDCPEIRGMYSGYEIRKAAWSYGMGNDKKSNEIIILSKN